MKFLFAILFSIIIPVYSHSSEGVISQDILNNLSNKKILLAGATGNNGRHILSLLEDLDVDFRAMSRNINKASKKFGNQYDWVQGDVTKPDTLINAVEGIDIVISAVATKMPFGNNRSERVDYLGAVNLINASKEAGVKRYIIITSSSSGVKDHFLNTIFNNMLLWKAKAEKYLVNSGLEYVVICPSVINDNPGGKKMINLIPRPSYEDGMKITRADLATVVVVAAGHSYSLNKVFTVINEEKNYSNLWTQGFKNMPEVLNLPN